MRRADLLLAGVATIVALGARELGLRGLLDANVGGASSTVTTTTDDTVIRSADLGPRIARRRRASTGD